MKAIFDSVLNHFSSKFSKSTIFVYGSLATGTFRENSGIDVLVFADVKHRSHDSSIVNGHLLDAWIHPTVDLENTREFIRAFPIISLKDDHKIAKAFGTQIEDLREQEVESFDLVRLEQLDSWVQKMIGRAKGNSVDSNYRYNWLLNDFPELYCNFKEIALMDLLRR